MEATYLTREARRLKPCAPFFSFLPLPYSFSPAAVPLTSPPHSRQRLVRPGHRPTSSQRRRTRKPALQMIRCTLPLLVALALLGCAPVVPAKSVPCERAVPARKGAQYAIGPGESDWLVRPPPPPPFLVDGKAFRAELPVSVQEDTRDDVVTFVLGEDTRFGPPREASKTPADIATDALDFVRDHSKSLALPPLTTFAADAPDPAHPKQIVWRGEATPNADSPCAKVQIRLEFLTTRTSGHPTVVRRKCVPGAGDGPRFVGRYVALHRQNGQSALLLPRQRHRARRKHLRRLVSRRLRRHSGQPRTAASIPLYPAPSRHPAPSRRRGRDARRDRRRSHSPQWPHPQLHAAARRAGAKHGRYAFCVAYVPEVGNTSTLGITNFEERGAATLPIVHIREWLGSYGSGPD